MCRGRGKVANIQHGNVGSANDPPNAATQNNIQNILVGGPEKIAHLALSVPFAAAHTQFNTLIAGLKWLTSITYLVRMDTYIRIL